MKKLVLILICNLSLVCYAASPCGLEGNIEQRIKNCKERRGDFVVVARNQEFEVMKDLNSGLLWSARLSEEICFECAKRACYSNIDEVLGIQADWRLPAIEEYQDAEKNNIRSSMRDMDHVYWSSTVKFEYDKSEKYHNVYFYSWHFNGKDGNTDRYIGVYNRDFSVRCVAAP